MASQSRGGGLATRRPVRRRTQTAFHEALSAPRSAAANQPTTHPPQPAARRHWPVCADLGASGSEGGGSCAAPRSEAASAECKQCPSARARALGAPRRVRPRAVGWGGACPAPGRFFGERKWSRRIGWAALGRPRAPLANGRAGSRLGRRNPRGSEAAAPGPMCFFVY